jgi:hypothetical protein
MTRAYRRAVLVFALLAVALGLAVLVKTAHQGGGTVGYAIGVLFVILGTARLYLLRKT